MKVGPINSVGTVIQQESVIWKWKKK